MQTLMKGRINGCYFPLAVEEKNVTQTVFEIGFWFTNSSTGLS
jgi:hypothetical protein